MRCRGLARTCGAQQADCSAALRCLTGHRARYPFRVPVTRRPSRSQGFPREWYPFLVVNEFLQRRPDLAQGVWRRIFKILWPSTGHLKLSPALATISTGLSTGLSTARGIRGRGGLGRRRPGGGCEGAAAPAGVARARAGPGRGGPGPDRPGQDFGCRPAQESSSRLPKLPNRRWPASAAVSATPRTAPISGSADRLQESWYDLAAALNSSPTEASWSVSRCG
jgi:hypothetical protein